MAWQTFLWYIISSHSRGTTGGYLLSSSFMQEIAREIGACALYLRPGDGKRYDFLDKVTEWSILGYAQSDKC